MCTAPNDLGILIERLAFNVQKEEETSVIGVAVMKIFRLIGLAAGWIVVLAVAAGMFIIFWIYRIGRFCLGYGWDMPGRCLTDAEILVKELQVKGTCP